jgi:hypothetical protein
LIVDLGLVRVNKDIRKNERRTTMKTTKFSTNKKIMTAASMLLLSTFMLSSATYAWFTMNKKVTVDGMEVRTKVGANLLICDTNVESDYTTALTQNRAALLEPVSTVDGKAFVYTVNANARGQALATPTWATYNENTNLTNEVAGKTAYDSAFNGVYGNGTAFTADTVALDDTRTTGSKDGAAYGYVDYTFYLKATNDGTDRYINMTKCNLLKDNAAIDNTSKTAGVDANRAWRVAVFVADTAAGTTAATPATGTATSILTLAGATNFTPGEARDSSNALDTVTYNTAVNIGDVGATAGTTAYYKVVVRLWLEGEDDTCNSATYAALAKEYTLDLEFQLQSAAGGVTNIGSAVS